MALKGSAVIELTDVNTGQKEVIKHDNLVTNAVNDILSLDLLNLRWGNDLNQLNLYFPVVPNLIGGIALFEDALEEDPAKYCAPASNTIVGYSNTDVSPETDARRGSMNQNESGALADGGYRFVFDFATSQGNGTISALALTSYKMGGSGYGSSVFTDAANSSSSSQSYQYTKFRRIGSVYRSVESTANNIYFASIFAVDYDNAIAYSAVPTAANTIGIYQIKLTTDSIGLNCRYLYRNISPELVATITTSSFLSKYATTTYVAFCDGGDGYLWGFQLSGNAQSGTTMLWIKISKDDWTFTEGTWTLPENVAAPGAFQPGTNVSTRCIVYDGLAYFAIQNTKGVLIVNTENPSDTTLLNTSASVALALSTNDHVWFQVLGDVVSFDGGFIIDRKLYSSAKSESGNYHMGYHYCCRPNIRYGPFLFCFYGASSTLSYVSEFLDSTYLATINNLDTPVTKTADKTMKITYILREE